MALHSRLVGNDDSHWLLGITRWRGERWRWRPFLNIFFSHLWLRISCQHTPDWLISLLMNNNVPLGGENITPETYSRQEKIWKTTLTCCGGKGGRARAAGVDGGQGWHRGAGTAAGGWSRMNLSIHRRTGHGRALLLSTVCRKQEEGGQLQVRNQKAFKRRCCPADTAVDGNQKHIFVTHISPHIAESYLNCVTCVLFSQ